MPKYNKMFLALEKWNIFEDGEKTKKSGENTTKSKADNSVDNKSNSKTENIADLRNSNTPQNRLDNVRDGSYVTEYNYNTENLNSSDNSTSTGKSNSDINNRYREETEHSPANKIEILEKMQNEINNIYTQIFTDLEDLFYSLI